MIGQLVSWSLETSQADVQL